MYKTRSRYLNYVRIHGKSKGADIGDKQFGPVDIIKDGEDYLLKIGGHHINLFNFEDKKHAILYARRKIKKVNRDDEIRGKYIKKIDWKLHNFVPESVFKRTWIKGGRE